MWTGKIEKVWCPESPTAKNAKYAGCETEDTIAHIAYCAKLVFNIPIFGKSSCLTATHLATASPTRSAR
jgi:hypothetical protein